MLKHLENGEELSVSELLGVGVWHVVILALLFQELSDGLEQLLLLFRLKGIQIEALSEGLLIQGRHV